MSLLSKPSSPLSCLPRELIQEIALQLPSTIDIYNFSLTNHFLRDTATAPIVFKHRLLCSGWDFEAWEEEPDSPGRWFRIDHIHFRLQELFDEAARSHVEPHSSLNPPRFTLQPVSSWGTLEIHPSAVTMLRWLEKMSKVLLNVLIHHRSRNIPHLLRPEYIVVWNVVLQAVEEFCLLPPNRHPRSPDFSGSVELASFSVMLLVFGFWAGNKTELNTVFGHFFPSVPFFIFKYRRLDTIPTFGHLFMSHEADPILQGCRFSACFVVLAVLRTYIVLKHRSHNLFPRFFLQPPSPPAPLVQPAVDCDWSSATLHWTRLYDGLQSMFTQGGSLPSLRQMITDEPRWVGIYAYTARLGVRIDPPMYINLRTQTPSSETVVCFEGTGHDGVGDFTLTGQANTREGDVTAMKSYSTHGFRWGGMTTPFGMVGRWGSSEWGGWWWIWPQKWSEHQA
ncbi:hypothetical protein EW146_g9032 [Bondarzewia mesenterica]|uniref:F-box domain-containing protein n=1 Tax=Bondarzewia mesenterica TaxID=1095465 RepID=A0A4S4LBI6_9AGAM|nr:hypothetical protein EW146_g9032 [Bondarzewia mesenterica]